MLFLLGFFLILFPLVIVHELGHFWFAKLFGVRADAFSIGFGPVIAKKQVGETEFRLSLIPLGGYVKLLGEDGQVQLTDEEKKRSLGAQATWKRFWIFFGGPLFNFIWAVIVFMVIFMLGEPHVGTTIGRVLPNSPAEVAGLLSGDQILKANDQSVTTFEDLNQVIQDLGGKQAQLEIKRGDANKMITVPVSEEEGFSTYGEPKKIGTIEGIFPATRSPRIGISNPKSISGDLGLVTGDEVIRFSGEEIKSFEDFEAKYRYWALSTQNEVAPILIRNQAGIEKEVTLIRDSVTKVHTMSGDLGKDLGLYSSELFVEKTQKDAPADVAGVQAGDRLVSIAQQEVRSFFELKQMIQAEGEAGRKIELAVERDGKMVKFSIEPKVSTERDPLLKKKTQYTIGVMPLMVLQEPVMVIERIWNPFVLVYKSVHRMVDLSVKNLVSIVKMFTGQVSVKSLGGPILIGKLAGESMSRGLIDFLKMMAVLSIGLGILNILPIPVLDGGHIVLLGVEAIRGKALSLRQLEVAQQVGLVFVLGIMMVSLKNDITRIPFIANLPFFN